MEAFIGPLSGGLAMLASPGIIIVIILGTLFGVFAGGLPGIGTTLAYGLALPFTFAMDVNMAVALLLAVTVGVAFGNSIPAILLGIPGSPAAILTVIDGHKIHKRGDSGFALALAYLGALGGQAVSVLFFIGAVVPLAAIAYHFLAPEMFSLYFFGVVALVSLASRNMIKGFMAAALGLLIGMIGLDPVNGTPRFDFGIISLRSGVDVAAVIIGLLAISELLRQSRQAFQWDAARDTVSAKFPSFARLRPTLPAMLTGTVTGTLVGAIPGAGGVTAAVLSYEQARLVSKHPEEFGNGSAEGVAANEAAQNSANSGELIPTLGLGIPASGSMVLLLAALSVHGFIAGPNLVREAPDLLAATVAGLLGSTFLLFIIGWPMARVMLKALTMDRSVIIVLSLIIVNLGIFSLNYRLFDVAVGLICGVIGYFMLRYGYSTAAASLAVVIAGGLEASLRRGLNLFNNDVWAFVSRPITAALLILALTFMVIGLVRSRRVSRRLKQGQVREAQDHTQ